ncbi:MAG: ATP-dependent sacrificial sulfur transferase LarE [Mogibacterium sp.]|nr:ATP-dependent sacrificial sulfur transferase LarE [Mogibacterium sp.]
MELKDFFELNPKAAIAFSGGVDSAYLLSEAVRLGADVTAYCVHSEFQPAFELEDARRTAAQAGADLKIIELSVLGDDAITSNPEDRCYHCKSRIMGAIREAAFADGYEVLLDGTNASDDADDRPGMRALSELGIKSPLRECGITKDMVREAARAAGLDVWDKPAYACLATRVPTGEIISEAKLRSTEKAESLMMAMGFRDFRVRWRGHDALVQVTADQYDEAIARQHEIETALGRYYDHIEIDENTR